MVDFFVLMAADLAMQRVSNRFHTVPDGPICQRGGASVSVAWGVHVAGVAGVAKDTGYLW
jgi:hypothetical protein